MHSWWFGDEDGGRCTGEGRGPDALADRLATIRIDPDHIIPVDWTRARDCGIVKDRREYIVTLREASLRLARERVAAGLRTRDAEIIRMVTILEGMDQATNLLTEHLSEWYRALYPEEGWKYLPGDSRRVLARIQENSDGTVKEVTHVLLGIREARGRLALEIGARAARLLPNSSGLVGGLVAARLMALAGSAVELARLPASSIQVLGAKGALFSHITRGSPPPKHGIIYQHKRVHNAPRGARGKVARVLAGRLAIAARIDFYRGMADEEFLAEASRMIEAAGERR